MFHRRRFTTAFLVSAAATFLMAPAGVYGAENNTDLPAEEKCVQNDTEKADADAGISVTGSEEEVLSAEGPCQAEDVKEEVPEEGVNPSEDVKEEIPEEEVIQAEDRKRSPSDGGSGF